MAILSETESHVNALAEELEVPIEEREKLRQELGLNDPVVVQFWRFVVNTAQGNFGADDALHGRVSRQEERARHLHAPAIASEPQQRGDGRDGEQSPGPLRCGRGCLGPGLAHVSAPPQLEPAPAVQP